MLPVTFILIDSVKQIDEVRGLIVKLGNGSGTTTWLWVFTQPLISLPIRLIFKLAFIDEIEILWVIAPLFQV